MRWLIVFAVAAMMLVGLAYYRAAHAPRVDVVPVEETTTPDVSVPITPPPPGEPSVGEGPSVSQPQPVYPTEEAAPDEEEYEYEELPQLGPLPRPPKPRRNPDEPFRPPHMTPGQ